MSDLDTQRPPTPNDAPSTHDLVIGDIRRANVASHLSLLDVIEKRRALGLRRYGTILQANNGRDSLQDALEEAADLVIYLRNLVAEHDSRGEISPTWLLTCYRQALDLTAELVFRRGLR